MKPLVSVVIPTHNRRELLALTLRSVLWQQGVSFEVIVVDDGGSDRTVDAVTALHDGRIRVLRNETPQGVSATRNRGIEAARGEWIAFIDDDDMWARDKLVLQVEAASSTGRLWVYPGMVEVDHALEYFGGSPPPAPDVVMAELPRYNSVPAGGSGVMARTEAVLAVGGFDTRLVNLADWDMWLRLARLGPPAHVPLPLVAYRIHAGNSSLNTRLIVREFEMVRRLHGIDADEWALHRYLTWLCFRSGRRTLAYWHRIQGLAAAGPRRLPEIKQALRQRRIRRARVVAPSVHDREWRAASTWVQDLLTESPEDLRANQRPA